MSRFTRVFVLATALLSLLAVLSSTAAAVSWTNDGDTTFTATSGPPTFATTGTSLSCGGASMTATVGSTPFSGVVWSAFTGTETYSGCLFAGVSASIDCALTFTAQSWSAGPPAVTTGNTDMTCNMWEFNSNICRFVGSIHSVYTNPVAPSTTGRLTFTTGGNLSTTNGTSGTCFLGSTDPLHFTERTLTVLHATGGPTPHLGPIFTRS